MSQKTIHEACRDGDLETVKQLIQDDAALVNADDEHKWRPIFHAGLRRRIEIVKFLIDAGADLSAHDGYVLHYAGEVPDNKEIVRMLMEYGALDAHTRPQDNLMRQFLAAVFVANSQRVKFFLQQHPELANRADGRGDLALHHAARNGDTEIVASLLDAGANVNAISTNRHTVLYCAAGHEHLETTRLLLDRGADPQQPFSKKGVVLVDWLEQFPDHQGFQQIKTLIESYG